MHEALLTTDSHDARSVSKSLDVDNVHEGNFSIVTKIKNQKIETRIKANSVSTLLSTLDDVIRCQMIAEKTIENGHC